MINKLLLLFICLFASSLTFCQTFEMDFQDTNSYLPRGNSNYLYLFSGEVIYGEKILMIKKPLSKHYTIEIDGISYNDSDVKFIDNGVFFANTSKEISLIGEPYFVRRVMERKINLYQETKEIFEEVNMITDFTSAQSGNHLAYLTPGITKTYNYYNMGYGNIKTVNYTNLAVDFSSNPRSMDFLNKYKAYRNGQIALQVIGCIAAIGVISKFAELSHADADYDRIEKQILTYGGLGIISFGVSIPLAKKKRQQIYNAIFFYNKS